MANKKVALILVIAIVVLQGNGAFVHKITAQEISDEVDEEAFKEIVEALQDLQCEFCNKEEVKENVRKAVGRFVDAHFPSENFEDEESRQDFKDKFLELVLAVEGVKNLGEAIEKFDLTTDDIAKGINQVSPENKSAALEEITGLPPTAQQALGILSLDFLRGGISEKEFIDRVKRLGDEHELSAEKKRVLENAVNEAMKSKEALSSGGFDFVGAAKLVGAFGAAYLLFATYQAIWDAISIARFGEIVALPTVIRKTVINRLGRLLRSLLKPFSRGPIIIIRNYTITPSVKSAFPRITGPTAAGGRAVFGFCRFLGAAGVFSYSAYISYQESLDIVDEQASFRGYQSFFESQILKDMAKENSSFPSLFEKKCEEKWFWRRAWYWSKEECVKDGPRNIAGRMAATLTKQLRKGEVWSGDLIAKIADAVLRAEINELGGLTIYR